MFTPFVGEQEASHAPTAERVYQIIHGGDSGPQPSESLSDEEELLEVDYVDLGKFISKIRGHNCLVTVNHNNYSPLCNCCLLYFRECPEGRKRASHTHNRRGTHGLPDRYKAIASG